MIMRTNLRSEFTMITTNPALIRARREVASGREFPPAMMASSGSVICFAFAEPVERRKVFKAMRGKPDVEVVLPSDLVPWDCRSAVYIGNAAGPPIMRLRDAISLLR